VGGLIDLLIKINIYKDWETGQKVGGLGDYDGEIGDPSVRAPTPLS